MTGRTAARPRGARAAIPAAPPVLAVAIAAALLAGATALAVLTLAATLRSAPPAGAPGSAAAPAAVVRAWVAALNAAAGGEAGPLARTTAPGFALHRAGEPDLDAARLAALLADLGRGTEGLRFTVGEIVADGEWAAARLTVTGGARRVAGTEIAGARPAVETAAFFRVADGLAAEAWAPDLGAGLPRTLPPARVPLWMSPTPAILARIVIPPGAEASGLATSGIHLLLPETGAVEAQVSGSALALDGDGPGGWQVIPATGRPVALAAGDALLVTSGAFHGVRNRGAVPASVLGFATAPYLAESGEGRQPPKTTPLTAIYHARLGMPVSLPGGVTSVTLARGLG
ncbi:MAG: nuclear transport factor 2 family protein, partial [Chloroflexota bacterium]